MNNADQNSPAMNAEDLYKEEIFTDRRVGAIKRLSPVKGNGESDSSRQVIYAGETQILLGNNPLPINFEIEAASLAEAADKFNDAAQQAASDTLKKLQEMRREMQSSIVLPGQEGMGGVGAIPGGGKIRMP